MISTDKNIFKTSSAARERMIEYGKLVRELHIIIFSLKKNNFENSKISGNVFLYPTFSFSRFCHIFNAYKISKKILFRNNKDFLITSQDPFETGIAGFLIKRKFKIPWQVQIHTDFLSPYFVKESLLNKIRVKTAKCLILRTDGIRVVSKRIKKSLIENLKISESKIDVLSVYVDAGKIEKAEIIENLREKYPEFDFIILMASRLSKEKNIPLAIKALKEIIKIYPKTGLVIAGDGKEKQNLLRLAINLGIKKNVKFLGSIEFKMLISYYKTADLYLLTSNYEGYSMSAVEAVISGVPVIMTDVGVAGEILKDKENTLIVPVGNVESLKNSVLYLIENSIFRDKIKENVQKVSESLLNKEEYFKKYYELWRKLLL